MSSTSLARPTQLIFSENPGALPADYPLPAGSEISIQSVVARINGAGAAAQFVPCLSIYSQAGKLIARVRTDQVFSVGDTGVVTFAPF